MAARENMEVLKISGKSSANAIAGAIAGVVRSSGAVELQAVGAAAINQAVKGVAIARGFVAPSGMDLIMIPAFATVLIEGLERTAIRFIVESR
jgi:stage V sporulation protein S